MGLLGPSLAAQLDEAEARCWEPDPNPYSGHPLLPPRVHRNGAGTQTQAEEIISNPGGSDEDSAVKAVPGDKVQGAKCWSLGQVCVWWTEAVWRPKGLTLHEGRQPESGGSLCVGNRGVFGHSECQVPVFLALEVS